MNLKTAKLFKEFIMTVLDNSDNSEYNAKLAKLLTEANNKQASAREFL